MVVLLFLVISYLLFCITLKPLFEKAGIEGRKALIPGVNFVEAFKMVGDSSNRVWWLLFPVYNIFVYVGLCIDIVRSFGKYKFSDSAIAFIYAPIIFFNIGKDSKAKYVGPTLKMEKEYHDRLIEATDKKDQLALKRLEASNPYKKGILREWTEAAVFAIFAAAFIRMFLIEAYQIPTSSMEGSLLVGDYLFVSKAHYGIRTPQTVAMVPLVHNRMPFFDGESYFSWPSLPYFRLPALTTIKNNDPVVFNYPEGDSVYFDPKRTWTVYDVRRDPTKQQFTNGKPLSVRPVDKADHYIKRCIGIAGDTLQIKNKQVYINGRPAPNPKYLQFTYIASNPEGPLNTTQFDEWGISPEDILDAEGNNMALILNNEQIDKIKAANPNVKIQPYILPERPLFPYDTVHFKGWSVDNYGPIWIPKKGVTIKIGPENIAVYRRAISVYEQNKLEERGGKIFINGKETNEYTFKWDYFWMMGDNRHNSEDSRYWGFVPETHIVGKPLFIWFSTKYANMSNGIRWDRIFTSANK